MLAGELIPLPRRLRWLADRGILGQLATAAIVILVVMLVMLAIDFGSAPERR